MYYLPSAKLARLFLNSVGKEFSKAAIKAVKERRLPASCVNVTVRFNDGE